MSVYVIGFKLKLSLWHIYSSRILRTLIYSEEKELQIYIFESNLFDIIRQTLPRFCKIYRDMSLPFWIYKSIKLQASEAVLIERFEL
jgi:hypothetical protein